MFGSTPSPNDDPGWSPVLRSLAWFLIPGVGVLRMRKAQARLHGLTILRLIFTAFVNALLLIGVVIAVLINFGHFKGAKVATPPLIVAVVAVGLVGLALGPRFDRQLDCSDDFHLAASYRDRFFIRVAFSEAAALVGFIAFVVTGRWWLYPLGAVFSALGYARLAPTAHHLAEDQEALRGAGCGRTLVAALAVMPPGRPPNAG